MMSHTHLKDAVLKLKSQFPFEPEAAIILGSGLGHLVQHMDVSHEISFAKIPGLPEPTVVGHTGKIVCGKFGGKSILAIQGRVHMYEGHSAEKVVILPRLAKLWGCHSLIVTNSAGGFGDQMKAGDLMIIQDQINLTAQNPLIGPNDPSWGPRFPDMSKIYDAEYARLLKKSFEDLGITYKVGTYVGVLGPSYETPAEIRFFKQIGGSAVGMSTVLETIAARHCGLKVAGLSCITNLAAGLSPVDLSHEEVTDTAKKVELDFIRVLKKFVESLP